MSEEQRGSDPAAERRPRVVLADDHPSVRIAFARLLEISCDVLEVVSDGSAALEAVLRLRPDVAVLDLMMPGMNGLDVCRRIKAAAPEIDILIVTAFDDPHVQDVAAEAGASAYIPKYAASALVPTVRQLFAARKKMPAPDGAA